MGPFSPWILHTAILHTILLEKKHFIYCLASTVKRLLKLPISTHHLFNQDNRQELTLPLLFSAREIAIKAIKAAQKRYKVRYDKKSNYVSYHLGDRVLV